MCTITVTVTIIYEVTNRQTDKQTDYCNPSHRPRAPRVNYDMYNASAHLYACVHMHLVLNGIIVPTHYVVKCKQ